MIEEVICSCDDGRVLKIPVTASTTVNEVISELCRIRSLNSAFRVCKREDIRSLVANDDSSLSRHLCGDENVNLATLNGQLFLKVFGFSTPLTSLTGTPGNGNESLGAISSPGAHPSDPNLFFTDDGRHDNCSKRGSDSGSEITDDELELEGRTKRRRTSKESINLTSVKVDSDLIPPKHLFIPDTFHLENLRLTHSHISHTAEDAEWNDKFDLLLEYGRIHGTCNVPQQLVCRLPDGSDFKLGFWLNSHRNLKSKGKLRPDRLDRLQSLVEEGRLAWTIDNITAAREASTDDQKWNQRFELLLKYGEDHDGCCNVPNSFSYHLDDVTEVKLGLWLHRQRQDRMKNRLRADRKDRLQQLVDDGKLAWVLDRFKAVNIFLSDDEVWNQRFQWMLQYADGHNGNCNVPQSYILKIDGLPDVKLGIWLGTQREKKKKGKLRADREQKLQELVDRGQLSWWLDGGVVNTDDHSWDLQYELMLQYGEEHNGNCNVPWTYVIKRPDETELRLGKWLADQRSKHKKGKLRKDRLDRLMMLVNAGRLKLRST